MNSDHKKYEDILQKYNYPFSSKEEILEAIYNIKIFADLIYKFNKRPPRTTKNLNSCPGKRHN